MDIGFTVYWVVALTVALVLRLAYFAIVSGDARGFHILAPAVALVLLLGYLMSHLIVLAYIAVGVVVMWLSYELVKWPRRRKR